MHEKAATYMVIYFGSPVGRYPTFHTLTSVGWKSAFCVLNDVLAFSCNSEIVAGNRSLRNERIGIVTNNRATSLSAEMLHL